MITLDYEKAKEEVFGQLAQKKHVVLATSLEGRVTARSMSCVVLGEKICFQTDVQMLKYKQLQKNPQIALCVDNIQIEGTARAVGHPFDKQNEPFRKAFQKKFPHSYAMYTSLAGEEVVEITPRLFIVWKYIEEKPLRDYIDLTLKRAWREYYPIDEMARREIAAD